MHSSKIVKLAEKIVKRDKEMFNTLLEFEKTKKINSKQRLNFTIDKSTAFRFRKFCKEKGYNMSAKIEQAINEIIKKN